MLLAPVPELSIAPPDVAAMFPVIVVSVTLRSAPRKFSMPPPFLPAWLFEKLLPVTVTGVAYSM